MGRGAGRGAGFDCTGWARTRSDAGWLGYGVARLRGGSATDSVAQLQSGSFDWAQLRLGTASVGHWGPGWCSPQCHRSPLRLPRWWGTLNTAGAMELVLSSRRRVTSLRPRQRVRSGRRTGRGGWSRGPVRLIRTLGGAGPDCASRAQLALSVTQGLPRPDPVFSGHGWHAVAFEG